MADRYLPAIQVPTVPTVAQVRAEAVRTYNNNKPLVMLLFVLLVLGVFYYLLNSGSISLPTFKRKETQPQNSSNIVIAPKPAPKPKPKPATTDTATSQTSQPAARVIARFGDKNKYYVRQVQEALNKLGENLEPDGSFGKMTMEALARRGFKNPKQVTDVGLATLRKQKKAIEASAQAAKAGSINPMFADAYLWWKSVTA